MKRLSAILFLLIGIFSLSACTQQAKKTNEKINVVSSVDFYAEPAAKILGKYGQVNSIINSASIDPHDYTATTHDSRTIAKADVAIMNGAGYDAWLQKLVASNNKRATVVNVAADIAHLPDGENEHLWYDFDNMIKVTRYLTKTFSQIKPAHKQTFNENSAKYIKQLQQLKEQEQTLKTTFTGKSVMVTEPVFNYVLQDLGVKIVNEDFAQAIDEGTDPKPADLQKMTTQLQKKQVAFLVVNKQVESSLIGNLIKTAKKSGVPIIYVTETMPKGKTYLTWMHDELQQLTKVAEGEK